MVVLPGRGCATMPDTMFSMERQRRKMVEHQLLRRGISDQAVLQAMDRVPRHLFVPEKLRRRAYDDCALPLPDHQTISQPFMVALMAQALQLKGHERVLEIGTGSGYAAAVLSKLSTVVYSIERSPALASSARARLEQLGYHNVHVILSDGTDGLPHYAPYDAISVAAASPWIPQPLREQIGPMGRLVIPVGGRDEQELLRLTRHGDDSTIESIAGVRFVPLVGVHGWQHN